MEELEVVRDHSGWMELWDKGIIHRDYLTYPPQLDRWDFLPCSGCCNNCVCL